jgi:hypothetical protein
VQQQLLAKHPRAPLKVDVVWLPMLPGDSRQLIDQRVLSDPRVTYFWDPNRIVGNWYSRAVTQQPGTTWDAFFLYDARARWDSTPASPVASGSTIIGNTDQLLSGFNRVETPTT